METIHSTSSFRWGHENTEGVRMIDPDPETFVPYLDADGEPVNQADGTPVMVPPAGFEPEYEKVDLETIVVIDAGTDDATVFKFALDKVGLSRFIAYYVQFLDAESRQIVREALGASSDIVTATPADVRRLELVKS